jgi:hypothetical protein
MIFPQREQSTVRLGVLGIVSLLRGGGSEHVARAARFAEVRAGAELGQQRVAVVLGMLGRVRAEADAVIGGPIAAAIPASTRLRGERLHECAHIGVPTSVVLPLIFLGLRQTILLLLLPRADCCDEAEDALRAKHVASPDFRSRFISVP